MDVHFSKMMSTTLFVVATIVVCSADIPTMGPCDVNVQTQTGFDFDKFHKEQGGSWEVTYGPATKFNENLSSLSIKMTPAADGQYRDIITYTAKDGKGGQLADEIITNNGHGTLTATTTTNEVYKVNVIKYVPGRYAFYYICSKEGSDQTIDYRYVLAHGPLTSAEKSAVYGIDKEYGFQGKLIPFGKNK
ncbi:uncharacterized protein LOC128987417 [Macrosteles quadrilineatus]|uniref:uncharacterized protein LOC128987417 n=1 Tax=Macrosteles quadrilineatus TaxID=74068 RepID=UPI0023E1CE3F|nr:uncharacterized protein LOC128987417 [Macrosteles quadrilineatus]